MPNVVAKRLLAKEQRESRKSDKTRKDDQKTAKVERTTEIRQKVFENI